jgi:hypothetical protein
MAELTQENTTGAGDAAGAVKAPGSASAHGGTTPAVNLTLTNQQFNATVGGAVNSVVGATEVLAARVPASLSKKQSSRFKPGTKATTPARALAMVGLLRTYGTKLGPLNINVDSMEDLANLANNATAMIRRLKALVTLVSNIRRAALVRCAPDVGIIYRRLLSVAEIDLALANALAPFRDKRVEAGKKGALNRKAKERARAQTTTPAPGSEGAQTTSTTTTTTTTSR